MSFSTTLSLNNIDDYIAPTQVILFIIFTIQNCIRPVKIEKELGKTKSIKIEADGTYTATTYVNFCFILFLEW